MSEEERLAAARANAAGASTLAGLHVALKARVAEIAEAHPLYESKTGTKAIAVVDHQLPPKEAGGDDVYPFMIVRPANGEDTAQGATEESTAIVKIIVGTYHDDDDGLLDVLNLIDALRIDFAEEPVLEGTAFEQRGPLLWEVPDVQPRPQWLGVVTTNWSLPRPQRVEARNPQED